MSSTTADTIQEEMARGEYLAAADLGLAAIEARTDDLATIWATGLALARAGATERATSLLKDTDLLDRVREDHSALAHDIRSLDARLAKDRARTGDPAAPSAAATQWARLSADKYAAIASTTESHYAAVNAATMYRIAGDGAAATRFAELTAQRTATPGDDYWTWASRAEAAVVLGDSTEASDALTRAAASPSDWAQRASTRQQLTWLLRALGEPTDVLDLLPVPAVAHYTGHMFAAGPEDRLRQEVCAVIDRHQIGAVYGSLASGADILIAEVAAQSGCETHVVLPCPTAEFVERSVAPAGPAWIERFDAALGRATSIDVESAASLDDEAMFAYGDQLAMGAAITRARQTTSPLLQIALWDGAPATGVAGAAAAVARWRSGGGHTEVVDLPRHTVTAIDAAGADVVPTPRRDVRAMLFADVKGFSALDERCLPAFFDDVMSAYQAVLEPRSDVHYRNTWGDALYLVVDTVTGAAEIANALHAATAELRNRLDWPELALRVGAHAGPVFAGRDAIRDEPTFYGTHVTRTARIEPRTPPGETYVSANFAALMAIEPGTDVDLDYVGHVPTAKDYGAFRMYLLRSRHRGDES